MEDHFIDGLCLPNVNIQEHVIHRHLKEMPMYVMNWYKENSFCKQSNYSKEVDTQEEMIDTGGAS